MRKPTFIQIIAIIGLFFIPTQFVLATDVSSHPTLPNDLQAYWSLDEAADTTRVDSKNANDLTETAGDSIASVAAIQDNGADFESGDTEGLQASDSADLSMNGVDLSIAGWFKNESNNNDMDVISKWEAGSNNREYVLRFNASAGNVQFFNSSDGSATGNASVSFTFPTTGTDFHAVVTFDLSAGELELFIDSVSQGTATGLLTTTFDGASLFDMGCFDDDCDINHYDGVIDELGIWSRLLTQAEIDHLYNSGNGVPYFTASTQDDNHPQNNQVIILGFETESVNRVEEITLV